MKANINLSRLSYLLELYRLSSEDFLSLVSTGLKKPIQSEEIFTEEIEFNFLKRIDKIFNKGLSFYVDPSEPIRTEGASIFFRKTQFNSELNLKSKKIVNEFEDLKLNLSAISKLAEIESPRILPIYSIEDNPKLIGREIQKTINYPNRKDQKAFLESLINKLGDYNILVFEFVETWNQKERSNIDGFFLSPNVIVLKRLDGLSYKREIFTLAHELGHYLLNIEEIEKIDFDTWDNGGVSDVENWCNAFAFSFLIGGFESEFDALLLANQDNDYHHDLIDIISNGTKLSKLALYTQLLIDRRISPINYSKVKMELAQIATNYYEEERKKKAEDKENGVESRGSAPTPIKSERLIYLVRTAFNEGAINEYQVCQTLKIKPNNLHRYIPV